MMFHLHILSFISTDNLATSFCEDDGLYKKKHENRYLCDDGDGDWLARQMLLF